MKKIIIAIVFLFFTSNLKAQIFKEEGYFYGGIKLGGSLSKVTMENFKYNFGFQVGVLGGYYITDEFAIELEMLASFRNTKNKQGGKTFLSNAYLDFPLLAKVYPLDCFYVLAGPQFAFNFSSDFNEFQTKKVNVFNFSAVGGIGYCITENFFIDARYIHSLNNLIKEVSSKFSMIQVGIGFLFSDSKKDLLNKDKNPSFLYK